MTFFGGEPEAYKHQGRAKPTRVIDAGTNVATNHLRIHEAIRRNAMGLKFGLRASRAERMPSGEFAGRVRHARSLVEADRCEEALRELQDLTRSLNYSGFEGSEPHSFARAKSPRMETKAARGGRPSDKVGPAARGRPVSGGTHGPGMRGAVSVVSFLTVMVTILAFAHPASASLTITVTDLGTLGGTESSALGINNVGQVVGDSSTATSGIVPHPFLWQNGAMTDLGTLGGSRGEAFAINDAGQVVGDSTTASGVRHAFLWQSGVMTDLGTLPGGTESAALSINNNGQVVGFSTIASGSGDAFLWQSGVMTDLGTLPGGTGSSAWGINDLGQVVGVSLSSLGVFHAFLWQNGVMTDLGTLPGEAQSVAVSINDLGQVVGGNAVAFAFLVAGGHAFLWQNGVMTDLGTLGGAFSTASGINNLGQVVGISNTTSGVPHAFLWQNGVMTDLGTLPGDTVSLALGINDLGQVVGGSATEARIHAVLWTTATPAQATGALIDQVQGLVSAGVLSHGQGQSLTTKLNAALTRMSTNPCTAINVLNAFMNEVNAHIKAGLLTADQGQPLLDSATAIIAQLEATASCS